MAIREMCSDATPGKKLRNDKYVDTEMLDEDSVAEYYRWCPTDDMKADLLTKKSTKKERLAWLQELHMVRIRDRKPKKETSPFAPNIGIVKILFV